MAGDGVTDHPGGDHFRGPGRLPGRIQDGRYIEMLPIPPWQQPHERETCGMARLVRNRCRPIAADGCSLASTAPVQNLLHHLQPQGGGSRIRLEGLADDDVGSLNLAALRVVIAERDEKFCVGPGAP